MSLKHYYSLAKPGIIYGNILTFVGGFAVGAHSRIGSASSGSASGSAGLATLALLAAALVGLSLVMASGSVFNNLIDRDIDAVMERTKGRALVTGAVSEKSAIVYGACLGLAGFLILFSYTNFLAVGFAAAGFFAYIALYSLWLKRRSAHGPIAGAIAGAVPPVAGYAAASGRFDAGAAILFAILALWQIPHFFAIAIYRFDDYAAAHIPAMPVAKGIRSTKIQMLFYIAAFIIAAVMLAAFGYAGRGYLVAAIALGAVWLGLSIKGFLIRDDETRENKTWARKMFFLSLTVLALLFIVMALDVVIPVV